MGSRAQRARRRSVKPDDSDPATEPVDPKSDSAGEALEPSCAACDTLLVAVV